jgi:hypothetical protein
VESSQGTSGRTHQITKARRGAETPTLIADVQFAALKQPEHFSQTHIGFNDGTLLEQNEETTVRPV